jgi:membrane associated rhomboid family serine protease
MQSRSAITESFRAKVFESRCTRLYGGAVSNGLMGDDWGRPRRFPPITIGLIVLNAVVFLIGHRYPLTEQGALSVAGLRHGHFWQLLSYQFLHANWIHLLLNCWVAFVFGRPVETVLRPARFIALYLLGGVAGGALQILAWQLTGDRFPHQVVGASAGVFGLVAAFTYLFPDARMTLLLFFVIPVRMTAHRMLMVVGAITVLGLVYPHWLLGRNVAHAAHLGGLIAGLIFVRLLVHRPPPRF